MAIDFCNLGSGSGGNSTVLRTSGGAILIDAGFGPRTTAQRLGGTGLAVTDIKAVVLTHLDHDHFKDNWLATLQKHNIKVFCCARKRRQIVESAAASELTERYPDRPAIASLVHGFRSHFEPLDGLLFEPISLAHDDTGSHGFVISCGRFRIGFATDLGHVTEELIEKFCGLDLLALESNYDIEMQKSSDRPWFLKQRIMGGSGHLSNAQAFAAVCGILDRTVATCGEERLPRHIVLLHRSRQCNCPRLLRDLFTQDPRIAPRLVLTDQYECTPWLRLRSTEPLAGEQMALSWR